MLLWLCLLKRSKPWEVLAQQTGLSQPTKYILNKHKMGFWVDFDIAITQLFAKRRQTIIASLGVTFGIGMFILMTSVMTGVNKLVEDTMLANSPHISLRNKIESNRKSVLEKVYEESETQILLHHQRPKMEKKELRNANLILKALQKDPEIKGVSPMVNAPVYYTIGAITLNGVVSGVDIIQEDLLFDLRWKMKEGEIENLLHNRNGIIMGRGLAEKLNVHMGDRVNVTTAEGVRMLLKIVGIFSSGVGAIDDVRSYANLQDVQQMLKKPANYITDINIKLHDVDAAKEKCVAIRNSFGVYGEDWETANAPILMSFVIRNAMTYIVVITLLVVAGFGIYNILNMTIYEKMKDIAILKAIGFEGGSVIRIFMLQSLIIGIFGAIGGLILGFATSYSLSRVPFDTGGVLATDTFPVNLTPWFYVYGVVFAMLTTAFAGYFPSRKASKIDPVAILRG